MPVLLFRELNIDAILWRLRVMISKLNNFPYSKLFFRIQECGAIVEICSIFLFGPIFFIKQEKIMKYTKNQKIAVAVKLVNYMKRRRAEGSKVKIEKPIYFTSYPRCVISIDSDVFRMYYRPKTARWHKA